MKEEEDWKKRMIAQSTQSKGWNKFQYFMSHHCSWNLALLIGNKKKKKGEGELSATMGFNPVTSWFTDYLVSPNPMLTKPFLCSFPL